MAKITTKSNFPSQAVTDIEKADISYGLQVAKAIEAEWFKKDSGSTRYFANRDNFHRLRLYARGEQSIQKYKNELSINGDLSYLNLDWKPVPIIPKFVDIVVNGMSDRLFDIKAFSQDPASVKERTDYVQKIMDDMQAKQFNDNVQEKLGINLFIEKPLSNLDNNTQVITDNKQLLQIMFDNTCNQIINLNKQLDNNLDVIKLLQKIDDDPADMVSQEKLVKLRKEVGIL